LGMRYTLHSRLVARLIFWTMAVFGTTAANPWDRALWAGESEMPDKQEIVSHLRDHLTMLTRTIGERSVRMPANLDKSADYLEARFTSFGLAAQRQPYRFRKLTVANIEGAQRSGRSGPHYVIGAHYDSVAGTVGADDNASAVAVMLETARCMQRLDAAGETIPRITYVAFTLEEPPAYGTRHMGSRVYAAKAREAAAAIDGMICLEMVGYTCHEPGCQGYPFPLKYLGYPKAGDFIGIVGNRKSLPFSRRLRRGFERNPNLPVVGLTVPFDGWIMPAVRLSDHASFWSEGYRAVMVTDSAFYRNPHYHTASDTMQTLDVDFMAELVRSLVSFFKGAPEQAG
jgi:hypothetical protein